MKRLDKKLGAAEQAVIRAAVGCLNSRGWLFEYDPEGRQLVENPAACRRLEKAVARLKEARLGR